MSGKRRETIFIHSLPSGATVYVEMDEGTDPSEALNALRHVIEYRLVEMVRGVHAGRSGAPCLDRGCMPNSSSDRP